MENDLALLTDGPMLDADEFNFELGWTLNEQGLCRGDVCVLVPDRAALERDGKIDAIAVAGLLDRPVAVDDTTCVVAIGAPRELRRGALDLTAPDFVLPDLEGTPHALSDHRSKKRLLVAFSTW